MMCYKSETFNATHLLCLKEKEHVDEKGNEPHAAYYNGFVIEWRLRKGEIKGI